MQLLCTVTSTRAVYVKVTFPFFFSAEACHFVNELILCKSIFPHRKFASGFINYLEKKVFVYQRLSTLNVTLRENIPVPFVVAVSTTIIRVNWYRGLVIYDITLLLWKSQRMPGAGQKVLVVSDCLCANVTSRLLNGRPIENKRQSYITGDNKLRNHCAYTFCSILHPSVSLFSQP